MANPTIKNVGIDRSCSGTYIDTVSLGGRYISSLSNIVNLICGTNTDPTYGTDDHVYPCNPQVLYASLPVPAGKGQPSFTSCGFALSGMRKDPAYVCTNQSVQIAVIGSEVRHTANTSGSCPGCDFLDTGNIVVGKYNGSHTTIGTIPWSLDGNTYNIGVSGSFSTTVNPSDWIYAYIEWLTHSGSYCCGFTSTVGSGFGHVRVTYQP